MAATFGTPTLSLGGDPAVPVFHDIISMTGDNPYEVGVDYVASTLLKAKIGEGRSIIAIIDMGDNATYYAEWDAANDRIVIYVRATGIEAGAIDLSAMVLQLLVISR